MSIQHQWKPALCAFTALATLAAAASAQSLLQTNGRILAASGGQVPGVAAGIVYGGTSMFDIPVLDRDGYVIFRGRLLDASGTLGVTPLNDRAIFRGTSAGDAAYSFLPTMGRRPLS